MISKLENKDNLKRKFRKIRQPEMLYKHLRQHNLGHLVQDYKPLEYQFSDDIDQLKTYLAQSFPFNYQK
jgi:hypothetical protein